MKVTRKFVSVLLSLMLFVLVGCETASDTPRETTPDVSTFETASETSAETTPEIALETVEDETSLLAEEAQSEDSQVSDSDALTATGYFESLCTANRLHNLITATYTGYTFDINNCFELSFQVHDLHIGLDVGDTVQAVYYPSDVTSTNPDDIIFTEGETYLILLKRYRNVYEDGDTYQVVGRRLLIPANDFQSATLYGTPLADYVSGMSITETTTLSEFIAYIQSITTENEQFSGQDYIQSQARVDIMTASPHVVTVTTTSVTSSMSTLTVTLRCRVDSVQKGTLTVGEYIDVMFPLDANVGLNETFILTLNDPIPGGMNWYMFSCKEAMYPISETSSIMAIINGDTVSE